MQALSLIGIVLAVVLFVYLAFKGLNLFFNAVLTALFIIITSQLAIMPTLKGPYMTGMTNFLKGYLLLFALSALFGKVMEDSGAVRRIALKLAELTKKSRNKKFWTIMILPVFYFILSYVGITGFVIVFTVVAIGRDLFEECDVPWLYYCYGSAGIYPAMVLGGSLYATNIIATEGFKVLPTAGFGLSVIMVIVCFLVLALLLKLDVDAINRSGKGFLPDGGPIKALQLAAPIPEERLPGFAVSVIPLLAPIIAILVFKLDVLIALTIAIALAFALGWKNINSFANTLSAGVSSSVNPVVNVAAATGLIAIIQISPGFKIISAFLGTLPPLLAGPFILMVMSGVVASSGSPYPPFLPYVVEKMAEAGVSAEIGARLASASAFAYMTPHNPGVVNAVSLTKLPLHKAASVYFKTTFIPGLVSFGVGAALVMMGIYK